MLSDFIPRQDENGWQMCQISSDQKIVDTYGPHCPTKQDCIDAWLDHPVRKRLFPSTQQEYEYGRFEEWWASNGTPENDKALALKSWLAARRSPR